MTITKLSNYSEMTPYKNKKKYKKVQPNPKQDI